MSLHQVHILQIRCRCKDIAELTIPQTNDLSELVILFLKNETNLLDFGENFEMIDAIWCVLMYYFDQI